MFPEEKPLYTKSLKNGTACLFDDEHCGRSLVIVNGYGK